MALLISKLHLIYYIRLLFCTFKLNLCLNNLTLFSITWLFRFLMVFHAAAHRVEGRTRDSSCMRSNLWGSTCKCHCSETIASKSSWKTIKINKLSFNNTQFTHEALWCVLKMEPNCLLNNDLVSCRNCCRSSNKASNSWDDFVLDFRSQICCCSSRRACTACSSAIASRQYGLFSVLISCSNSFIIAPVRQPTET